MAESEATSAQGMAAEESASVSEDQIQQLATGIKYRHHWGARNGQWRLNLNWGAVSAANHVYVAIHEGNFIGDARYTLHNVAPRNGGVSIWVNIEWASPINLFADYFVV
jgi:hypothetical protein